jgi:hypothetical protein
VNKLINELLLKKWDPIGICDMPEASDEYSHYVPKIYGIIQRSTSSRELFEYLWELETQHMGLKGNRSETEQFAEFLFNQIRS